MRRLRSSSVVLVLIALAGCARSRSIETEDAGPMAPDARPAIDAGLTVPPGQIAAWTNEDDRRGVTLMIEVWDRAVSDCVPPADVDLEDLLVLGIEGWDRRPGTWVLGEETERGVARAVTGSLGDMPRGTLTLEPFDVHPRFVAWELEGVGSGRADLGRCGRFE